MDSETIEGPPSPVLTDQSEGVDSDPLWYKDAVIYQLHVKAFRDSNDDGMGDFPGLTERLDYIEKLGATVIWLLPFYPSPLRDDGYDIADYRKINPSYGEMRDFRRFVKEAHKRGLRVITELVINHTSDQHPWFQKAREAKPGSAARDFYVWSDTDQKYEETRIIFIDTETSNWTWDPVAKQYFWHRFYSHQPDLNFDNPKVMREVVSIMRYWLDMGVDGLRLDAIPYLVERDGTNNENLPETHVVLKQIRAAMDEKHKGRMLLAEANQWPEDTAPYFGDGDECHMAFHFPLMPRMYMALAQEDRHPITDIIRQLPDIPENCQWAIFLRNHDELTLEMVTEEERDYLWRTYAEDKRARINLGIRRRLAPLMQNDRRKIELLNALLLSMPGTPVLYYGDELGMGDNYFLGDRDGVRTPMQWTADRNAGFSRAKPQQLYLPPVMDPVYGYQSINVEAQESDPSSLLNWTRRMVAVRSQHRCFGRGTISFLYPSNRKVLAYVREHEGERILCVANLSRASQAVELDLSDFHGVVPLELGSRTAFPPIGDLPYLLTFPGYGFYWFLLTDEAQMPSWHQPLPEILPEFVTLTVSGNNIASVLTGRERKQLESDVLPHFLPLQRWYGDKQTAIKSVSVNPLASLGGKDEMLSIAEVQPTGSSYFMPLTIRWGEDQVRPGAPLLSHTMAKARTGPKLGAVTDAAFEDDFAINLMTAIRRGKEIEAEGGTLEFEATRTLKGMAKPSEIKRPGAEQSNVSVIVDDAYMLKMYRRLQPGVQPDVEVGRFLTEVAGFEATPAYLGSVRYVPKKGDPLTLASAFAFVFNQGDAWASLLDGMARNLETHALGADLENDTFAYPFSVARTLGRRTGEMHAAFATPTDDPAFAVEALRKADLKAWSKETSAEVRDTLKVLRGQVKNLPEEVAADARSLMDAQSRLLGAIKKVESLDPSGGLSRIHGDYHLGQVLIAQSDVVIVDFEGEPMRSMDERRAKSSPMRDVAGMVRSFDYLAWAALDRRRSIAGDIQDVERESARRWRDEMVSDFLDAYFEAASGIPSLPDNRETTDALLRMFTIHKALYEVRYEAANRPAWLSIPVRGILEILNQEDA